MSDSEPGFAEKVVVEEREYKGSYRTLVSSMRFRNPILAKLDKILTRQGPPSEDGRVAVIELHDNHVRRLHTSDKLLDYMTNLEQAPPPSCNRRLYLLEGLPASYIEILGSRLRIDPDVFARQIDCGGLAILKDAQDIPMLPSHPTSKESFSLRYNELRDFGENIDSFDFRCTNQPRRISTTRWEGKFDGVGIVRRKASFWSRMNGADGWNDPPVGEYFYMGSGSKRFMPSSPYRGGFVDFSPLVKSTLEFDNATTGPGRVSALDYLCHYWTHSELAHDLDFNTPAVATIFLKRYIASHWMVLLQYSHDLLRRHEYTVNRASKVTDISASKLEHCWTGVQYLNNRASGWCEHVDSSIHQFTITGTLGDFPGELGNNTAEDDFIQLSHGLRGLKEEIETVTSSITGLLSIYETKRMKELANLGMLFLPLTFTSGIFNMAGNYAPGGSSFWVYWVVAGPLVLLMLPVVFGLNSGTAPANLWLLKTRLFKQSPPEKFPRKSPSDLV